MGAPYSAEVMERCRHPHRAGAWPEADPHVGTGVVGSLDAGTMTRLQLRVDPQRLVIEDARFKVFGCSAAVASASLAADSLVGTSIEEARDLDADALAAGLSLPEDRWAMADHAVQAARAAVDDWTRKAGTREMEAASGGKGQP